MSTNAMMFRLVLCPGFFVDVRPFTSANRVVVPSSRYQIPSKNVLLYRGCSQTASRHSPHVLDSCFLPDTAHAKPCPSPAYPSTYTVMIGMPTSTSAGRTTANTEKHTSGGVGLLQSGCHGLNIHLERRFSGSIFEIVTFSRMYEKSTYQSTPVPFPLLPTLYGTVGVRTLHRDVDES